MSKDKSYQPVPRPGDDAYLVNVFGQNVLYVNGKGYQIVISGVGAFNNLAVMEAFAVAVIGRI